MTSPVQKFQINSPGDNSSYGGIKMVDSKIEGSATSGASVYKATYEMDNSRQSVSSSVSREPTLYGNNYTASSYGTTGNVTGYQGATGTGYQGTTVTGTGYQGATGTGYSNVTGGYQQSTLTSNITQGSSSYQSQSGSTSNVQQSQRFSGTGIQGAQGSGLSSYQLQGQNYGSTSATGTTGTSGATGTTSYQSSYQSSQPGTSQFKYQPY
jgi:hypothetical protein